MRSDKYADFITFLGIAQSYDIDFLPISWLPAMDIVGAGATAEIRQKLATYQVTFAFKRLTKKTSLQPLIAELRILGHPAIQKHPNILKLEGICWDIDRSGEVWPVLVFQKSHHLDLGRFMCTDTGRQLSLEAQLEMLADIASAIMTMHANGKMTLAVRDCIADCHKGIVHGDLKPQNILIFDTDNGSGQFIPQVADFGYSVLIAKDKMNMAINMPATPGWCAPEWYQNHTAANITAAKKMDTFSFGLLCAWLLFHTTSANGHQNGREYRPDEFYPSAVAGLISSSGISATKRLQLQELFNKTLAREPQIRCSDVSQCLRLLTPKRYACSKTGYQ
jgi:serine/threonine protein kinase